MRIVFVFLTLALLFFGSSLIYKGIEQARGIEVPHAQYGLLGKLFTPEKMLFTGDVMLGRSVEITIDENGIVFPFQNLIPVFRTHEVVVGNFEASVPEKHVHTPSNGMVFSVRQGFIPSLRSFGFDILSLANNHSSDYGSEGYTHTVEVCKKNELVCIGNSSSVGTSSLHTTHIAGTRVGTLFLHTNFTMPTEAELLPLLNELKNTSEIQVAYIHWGDEYELTHNDTQEKLAYFLIDNGFDAIIGHHPHVIQDVEQYKGKPIFYSLGNLIFDQYFSTDVQQGYLVSLEFKKRELAYTLLPYETLTVRSQPAFVTGEERKHILERILPQTMFTAEEVQAGGFTVPRD